MTFECKMLHGKDVLQDRLHLTYFRKALTTRSTIYITMNARRLSQALVKHRHQQHSFSGFIYRRKATFISDWRTRETTPKGSANYLEHRAITI